MAYKIGLIVWLLTIALCTLYGLSSGDFFGFPLGAILGFFFGTISTVLFFIYTFLVFLFNRNKTAFLIALILTFIAIICIFIYWSL